MASEPAPRAPICWVVTDGKAGMESQCVGLAEALAVKPVVKRVGLRWPWRRLTPHFRFGGAMQFASSSDPLVPPWPDLLIATGRHSVAASVYVREMSVRSGKRTITVQLQNPGIAPSYFDLVVVPRHDQLSGVNIVEMRGALHRVTQDVLRAGAAEFGSQVSHLRRPYVAVLLGGSNGAYTFGIAEAEKLGAMLAQAAQAISASLLITPSRRTSADVIRSLENNIGPVPHYLWGGQGANPYFGMLGLADFIVVTSDSVNMVSEAAATGKPVYVFDLPGGSAKFARFHDGLRKDGIARAFTGTLESYRYAPVNDMEAVVARVNTLIRR